MKYIFVRDHREAFPADLMFWALGVGIIGFYAWLKRPESPRRRDNLWLLTELKAVYRRSRKTYGDLRTHAELSENGHACSRYRVARLMRQYGFVSKHKKKFRVATNSVHSFPIVKNLLQRQFNVARPGQCWVSDIV
jgi:putative transposase